MFGWFTPRCPVTTWEKAWTEVRLGWLVQTLGPDRLQQARVILPTDEFFPDPYSGTASNARQVMDRLCGYMGVAPHTVELEVHPDTALPGAAGTYYGKGERDRAVIRVAESQVTQPMALAATLSHELAHEILLGGGLVDPTVTDHEWLTDLLLVYLGVGVFAANTALHEEYHSEGTLSWWRIGKQGYLPARVFGYALALFALLRGEVPPDWATHLRVDAASALRAGLRYIQKTKDCLLHPDSLTTAGRPWTIEETLRRLQSGTPSARLASLWQIREQGWTTPVCQAAVTACLRERDPDLAEEAARLLAVFGPSARAVLPDLCAGLRSPESTMRAAAASTLGTLKLEPERVVPELCVLLDDTDPAVFFAAAWALGHLGLPVDEFSVGRLLSRLEAALIDCDEGMAEVIIQTLRAVSDSPEQWIRTFFRDRDLRRLALAAWVQQRQEPVPAEGKLQ